MSPTDKYCMCSFFQGNEVSSKKLPGFVFHWMTKLWYTSPITQGFQDFIFR